MSCKNPGKILVCFFDRFVIVCKFRLSLFLFRKCFNILKAVKKVNNIFFLLMNWYTVPKLVFEFSVKKILLKKGVQLWLVWIKTKNKDKLSRNFLAWLWIRCIKPLSFDVSKTNETKFENEKSSISCVVLGLEKHNRYIFKYSSISSTFNIHIL